MLFRDRRRALTLMLCVLIGGAAAGWALVEPQSSPIRGKEMRHPALHVDNEYVPASRLTLRAVDAEGAAEAVASLASLGVTADAAYLDVRTGRWGTLMPSWPLIPGRGNELAWNDLGALTQTAAEQKLEQIVWQRFVDLVRANRSQLKIDVGELPEHGRVVVHDGGELVQIFGQRSIGGVPVRDSYLTAVVNHGNVVLFGARNWNDLASVAAPKLSREAAEARLESWLEPLVASGRWGKATLEYVPVKRGDQLETLALGDGLEYRLAWVINPSFDGDLGHWEALVDASSGEMLAFADTNHYATTREVVGGVLPIANDGVGPEGTEQAAFPMPYADASVGGETAFTDGAGNLLACVDGEVSTTLSGRYMRMVDACGDISESSAIEQLDLGMSGGTDCSIPVGASAGNTHSSRSGYYEMNRMIEMARSHLPDNPWLQQQLTSNMNINLTCNAFWSGASVNFYRSGGGCGNTGEIAGVYDHEWGHGMDDNDALPYVSNPGEGIADIYASLRLNTSCIGRSFSASVCGGFGDPCLSCTGVRDIDWAKRQSGVPHDVKSDFPKGIDAMCGSGSFTPCGGSTHCEGAVYAEAVWDLWNRDLTAPPFNMSLDTAREVATQLTFRGAGGVGTWFQCVAGFAGCNADGGYLNYLAADDDNGNLADGTPHMEAIYAAFNRHGIACGSPSVVTSGCAGAPTTAPTVNATPRDRGVSLSWTAIAGAVSYRVYRTEGVFGCDFGKVLVGETTGTSFEDDGLLNGTEVYYTVIPMGASDTCFGPASACTSVTPASGLNIALDNSSVAVTINPATGDGDAFLDNCEQATVSFDALNVGTGTVTDLQLVGVSSPSHPEIDGSISFTPAVSASLSQCGSASSGFSFTASGLATGDDVDFKVCMAGSGTSTVCGDIRLVGTEQDVQFFASKTFSFESDSEGWTTVAGTYGQTTTGGGADGSAGYMASSTFLDNQCDGVQSPEMALSATSTLSLWNNYDIEGFYASGGVWYDRANVGLRNVASGERSVVVPDGGRSYDATGANGTCETNGQDGWAGSNPSWAESTFSATALDAAAVAGDVVNLDVRYGTDPGLNGAGFWFDEVTVTDVFIVIPDAQQCTSPPTDLFSDDFETGDLSEWSMCTGCS